MRTSTSSRGLAAIVLLTLTTTAAFQANAQIVQINTGAANTPLYAVGPIYMSTTLFYRYSRFAYLYTQSELAAAGILPGAEILTVGWMKSTPSSTAGPAVFSIYMKNSSATAYAAPSETWSSLSTGATQVYTDPAQSIPSTASPNYIDFTLTSPFIYTGGALEILTEWDISAGPTPIATGAFEWVNTTVVDRIYASGNTSLPNTLSSTTNNTNMDDRRPVIQLTVNGATGVNEILNTAISLWPNPAEGFLQIRNDTGAPVESIVMTNALGQVVLAERPSGATGIHRVELDELDAGHYLIEIRTGNGRVVKQVTVL